MVGIEANPSFELLALNVTLNGLSNVRLLRVAAGDRRGNCRLLPTIQNTEAANLDLAPFQEYGRTYDSPERLSVEMNHLDDVVTEREFDLIVTDIEGSEAIALRGMPEIIANSQSLLLKFLPHHLENVAQNRS